MTNVVAVAVLNSPRDGLFAASCFMHCGFTLDQPTIGGTMVIDALWSWIQRELKGEQSETLGSGFKWIDDCPAKHPDGETAYWPPCNPTCPLLPTTASTDLSTVPTAEAPWQGLRAK